MALENINERRSCVSAFIKNNEKINTSDIKKISIEFKCSTAAVYADIANLRRIDDNLRVFANKKIKDKVFKRDNYTCQYCGTKQKSLIAEHVIPFIMGGVAEMYNLVASCQSCNSVKKKKISIPNNIDVLKLENEFWHSVILKEYENQQIRKNIDLPKYIVDRIDFEANYQHTDVKKLIEKTLIDKFNNK